MSIIASIEMPSTQDVTASQVAKPCLWPMWSHGARPTYEFCCAPRVPGAWAPYCAAHRARATTQPICEAVEEE